MDVHVASSYTYLGPAPFLNVGTEKGGSTVPSLSARSGQVQGQVSLTACRLLTSVQAPAIVTNLHLAREYLIPAIPLSSSVFRRKPFALRSDPPAGLCLCALHAVRLSAYLTKEAGAGDQPSSIDPGQDKFQISLKRIRMPSEGLAR